MFHFAIEVHRAEEHYESSYNNSSSMDSKQEIFDMNVTSFSEAITFDKILDAWRFQTLLEIEERLGYDTLCQLAKVLGGCIKEQEINDILNGLDMDDVVISYWEPLWIGFNNRKVVARRSEVMQSKWDIFYPTIEATVKDTIIEIMAAYGHNGKDDILKLFNERMSSAFDGFVELNDYQYSRIIYKLRESAKDDSADYTTLLLQEMAQDALQVTFCSVVEPTPEEMGELQIIDSGISQPSSEEGKEDFWPFSEDTVEDYFAFRPLVQPTNRVVVLEAGCSGSYCND